MHYTTLFLVSPINSTTIKTIDLDAKSITLAITTEPPKLNSMISTDSISFMLLDHLTEGLMGDKKGKLTGAIAEKWRLTESKGLAKKKCTMP